jgi:hypothetical protein
MPAKVLSGARAKLGFYDGNQVHYVGIFSDCSYALTYDVQQAWILGRYSAAESDYTAQEPVHVSASGYRIVDHGWFKDAQFPNLASLMDADYMTLEVSDRQTGKMVARIDRVRPVGASGGFSARQLSTSTHTYVGLLISDESEPNNTESANAMELPG